MNVSNPETKGGARLSDLAAEMERATGILPSVASVALSVHTTMRVGGPADLYAQARDVAHLSSLVRFARRHEIPYLVLGRGSDLVVSDAGIRGLVILNRAEGARVEGTRLVAESGLPLASAATMTQEAGLTGLEFGLAVPGSVGGAVWANAGAHGSDIAAVLESATVLRADGTEAVEPVSAMGLGYRESRFKHSPGDLILGANFNLSPDDPAAIESRLAEIRAWRREHQPLTRPSAGSIFRNPPGDSAGRLIDACGLRGSRLGGAAISEKHANFIVNMAEATAADIRSLAERARQAVSDEFAIELEYEVQFIGDWSGWSGR
jgi:UDP-N-acetylmuramate dehydrogenase